MHVNRLLYGPLKLQLIRYQLDVELRNKLSMSICTLYIKVVRWCCRVSFLSIQKVKYEWPLGLWVVP